MAHTLSQPMTARPRRVLVVDDSAAQRALTSAHLRRWGFVVSEAENGRDGLCALQNGRFDVVISDWMMPKMDGLELCSRFRAAPIDNYTYFVLVTSKSEKEEIAEGLEAGADDFLTKPFNADELRARLNAGIRIVEMDQEIKEKSREVSDAYDELQKVHGELERDLREAGDFQQSLLPERHVSLRYADISFALESCGHVGGDLVGTYSISETRVVIFSLDVSGHGISSALLTARLASHLKSTDLRHHAGFRVTPDGQAEARSPAEIAALLNDRMLREVTTEHYFTMALLDIDMTTGKGRFVQAGHPPPIVVSPGKTPWFVGAGGPPIGLVDGMTFEDVPVELKPDEAIMLYSDGIVEAEGPLGEMYGEDRMVSLLDGRSPPFTQELLSDILWDVKAHQNGAPMGDDISAALFWRRP
ncbi:MAG: SpoIIE family protein phosphatase [Pseudomonadota bacterium]